MKHSVHGGLITIFLLALFTTPAWSHDNDDRGCSGKSKTFCTLTVTGSAKIGTLFVTGNETVGGNLLVDESLSVNGPAYFTSIFINGVPVIPVTDPFVQGGNSFGETALLGTNDNFGLNIETAGSQRIQIANTGEVNIIAPDTGAGVALSVNGNNNATAQTINAGTAQVALDILNGNINLTNSTSSSTGNITKAGSRFLHNYGTSNTFLGVNAGNFTMTGTDNVGVGNGVMAVVTSGIDNTAMGSAALASNTDGDSNTAMGSRALTENTGGVENTAVGLEALAANKTGDQNTAVGVLALASNTVGDSNTAMGSAALTENTTGTGNTALGSAALAANKTANSNTAVGGVALFSNTTGNANTALGESALRENVTGSSNTAVGLNSLRQNLGDGNTALGQNAGSSITTGSDNTALGQNAGQNIKTGTNNIMIGRDAGVDTGARTNCIVIGAGATTSAANNQIRIGFGTTASTSAFIDGIRGATTGVADAIAVLIDSAGQLGTVSSSRRYKENIQPLADVSQHFMQLNPVEFTYKTDSSHTPQYGLIAEEVETLFPELVVYNKDGEVESVKYHLLYAFYIKMIQDLQRTVDQLNARIELLEHA